jgi:hypothetical protein
MFDDGVAKRDLAVTRDGNFTLLTHTNDRRRVN